MALQADVLREEVAIDKYAWATGGPCIRVPSTHEAFDCLGLHLNMESVACPVSHIVEELIILHYDVGSFRLI